MNERERQDVLTELKEKVRPDGFEAGQDKNPVIDLWSSADLKVCGALVSIYSRYINHKDLCVAEALKTASIEKLYIHIQQARKSLIEKSEELDRQKAKDKLARFENIWAKCEYLIKTNGFSAHPASWQNKKKDDNGTNQCAQIASLAAIAIRLAGKSLTTVPVLDHPNRRNSFLDFLLATDSLAKSIDVNLGNQSQDSIAQDIKSEPFKEAQIREENQHFMLALMIKVMENRGGDGSILKYGDINVLKLMHSSEVLSGAFTAYECEVQQMQTSNFPYPKEYTATLNVTPELMSELKIWTKHSYFSTRLACLALFNNAWIHQFRGFSNWMLCRYILGDGSLFDGDRPKDFMHRLCGEDYWNARGMPVAASVHGYLMHRKYDKAAPHGKSMERAASDNEKNGKPMGRLTTETDASDEWHRSLGEHGANAAAGNSYLKVNRKDVDFVVSIYQNLRDKPFSDTADVAIIAKYGVYFGSIYESKSINIKEPTCKTPTGAPDKAATGQIKNIRKIAQAVLKKSSLEEITDEIPVVFMAKNIYYDVDTGSASLRNGFCWNRDPNGDWGDLTSDQHVEDNKYSGSHVWLYGKKFQEVVDETIRELENPIKPDTDSSNGMGGRFARFVFLVPQTWDPLKPVSDNRRKALRDWPGVDAMRHLLFCVAGAGKINVKIKDFDVKANIYDPVVLRKEVTEQNIFFSSRLDILGATK